MNELNKLRTFYLKGKKIASPPIRYYILLLLLPGPAAGPILQTFLRSREKCASPL